MGSTEIEMKISPLDQQSIAQVPADTNMLTVLVEIPPQHPGNPPHRHPGAVYGYLIEGEMLFEMEGDAPRIISAGEAFSEPGGDRIHYQDGNPGDVWLRFVVMMVVPEGAPLLALVEPKELERRQGLRHLAAASAPPE